MITRIIPAAIGLVLGFAAGVELARFVYALDQIGCVDD